MWGSFHIMADHPPEPPAWPSYQIGPHDTVFALGVASVNYGRLEFAFSRVFAAVFDLTDKLTRTKLPKLNNEKRIKYLTEGLRERDWPSDRKERIQHFVDAFEALVGNRNNLAHSSLTVFMEDPAALYKSDRNSGNTIATLVSLKALRQIADDMHIYFNYGMNITNCIGIEMLGLKPITGTIDNWPDKPPLPFKLEYKQEVV
jgi:hypothetical protein